MNVRPAIHALLNKYARKLDYEVVHELSGRGMRGKNVRPDGVVKNRWSLEIGLWESKDAKDDLAGEIAAKIQKGYSLTNILFEDGKTAVLYQYGAEVSRADMRNPDALHDLLTKFFAFKNEVVTRFEDALTAFKVDVPKITSTLREEIIAHREKNSAFAKAQADFLTLCKAEINPDVTVEDVREMMIQHIMTCDIFNKIFDDNDFYRHNSIAAELEKLIEKLLTYQDRRNLLASTEHYYDTINATAAGIPDHHEKQKFLKVLYENFYQAYNPKAADRLGVVYTPNEIVHFMIKITDRLLDTHFQKSLSDEGVDILDPATGTGTFICDIIEYIQRERLEYKFQNEIHANEVSILPFYIANLNIEYTYKQKMNKYADFPGLCFVDTLDNTDCLMHSEHQRNLLFGLSSVNTERIRRQNSKEISVIIGNPPYNANQKNENENNKNREYKDIDERIRNSYVDASTAQKTKVYDMYARFYRWATDRIDKNGIIAFVTNRSFVDSRTFDGFRKCIQEDFSHCYIIDTRSDVRTNPRIAGTTHNVFGIQTGVAIMFLIKKVHHAGQCMIHYYSLDDTLRREEKLDWLREHADFDKIRFERIRPDKNHTWINQADENDWDALIPVACKAVKANEHDEAVFKLYSLGISTNRDEWVYDFSKESLLNKMEFFVKTYDSISKKHGDFDTVIKWSRNLKRRFEQGKKEAFSNTNARKSLYRPFVMSWLYDSGLYVDERGSCSNVFPLNTDSQCNKLIMICGHPQIPITIHATKYIPDAGYSSRATQFVPLYRYEDGKLHDNITAWGLKKFQEHYLNDAITRDDIFHYTYAVLHNPAYLKKYEINLKREFPRLPFYKDFNQWASWGKSLMDVHIEFESAKPYPLKRHDSENMFPGMKIKVKLKADKAEGTIEIDELTTLHGIPPEAWHYKLGNRTALEWVLDQYKEKKPKDPTIAEKFDTYCFADYKEQVIELLKKVCTASVETVKIIREMNNSFDIY